MTPEQRRRFYFPAWGKVASKYDWRMEKRRLICDLGALQEAVNGWQEQTAREVMLNVLRYAGHFARQNHRAIEPDDLRHACNFVAAKVMSSDQLTGKQLQRVVCLFDVLAAPMNLRAIRRWENPEAQEREDLVAQIGKLANEAAIRAICRNSSFDRANWRDLPTSGLTWLRRTLLQRQGGGTRRSALKRDLENEPF